MSEKHEKLKQRAKEAIDDVFGDTSVSQEQTLESLRELIDEIDFKINSLKEDMKI